MTAGERIASALLRGYSRVAPTQRGAYRLVRLGRRFIPRRKWSNRFVTPGRITLDLDIATYPDCMMAFGLYELDTLRVLRGLLRKSGGWFVDCGANVGYFALLASKWCERVDAFEPDPPNLQRLKENIRSNHRGKFVNVHDVALSDHNGEFTLYHPTGGNEYVNHGMAGAFASTLSSHVAQYQVRCVRLDEYLPRDAEGRGPDVIKIDIEGGELAAVQGMSGLISCDHPPALIVEHNPATASAAGFTPGELFRTLLELQPRYRVYWIGRRLHRFETPEALNAITREGNILLRA